MSFSANPHVIAMAIRMHRYNGRDWVERALNTESHGVSEHRTQVMLMQVDELRDRLSRMSAASLRINESLDLETVLESVLDSARSLTGARNGVIILVDDAGRILDFVTSGLTPEEHRQFSELPEGTKPAKSGPGPLRLMAKKASGCSSTSTRSGSRCGCRTSTAISGKWDFRSFAHPCRSALSSPSWFG